MDISQSLTNANTRGKQSSGKKNKELIKREEIKGTPFEIVTDNRTKKHFIGMGNYRLSEEVEEKSELERRIKEKDWLLMMYMTNAVIDARERHKPTNTENN